MWKKLGLPKPIPYDSDNEAWDTTPPATTSTETPPATEPATGRTDSPAAQTYRRQKKRQRTPPPPSTIDSKTNPAGEMLPEATTPTGHSHKRPRTQSPPRSELEPTIAIHPAGLKESGTPTDSTNAVPTDAPTDFPSAMPSDVPSDAPTDFTSAMPSDVPTDVPTDAPVDLPSDVPSDAPTDFTSDVPSDVPTDVPVDLPSDVPSDVPSDTLSDMPSNLPSDLPRPAYPDHIVKSLTFNKISERTRLLKVSSLPYHPGKYIHHATLGALRLHSQAAWEGRKNGQNRRQSDWSSEAASDDWSRAEKRWDTRREREAREPYMQAFLASELSDLPATVQRFSWYRW
ncbi:cell surface glycoprotein 1-like [Manihot esculenta]|uniref:cell surface glycoprotein 1-like n=1 Tax=Manihot esculenta TaxID=3983 RepID=UPI001CC42DF5|nr:cell surface glycoprotein 1-like [Manihot esculenta]